MFFDVALLLLGPLCAYEGAYAFRSIRGYELFEQEWAFHHVREFFDVACGVFLLFVILSRLFEHLTAAPDGVTASANLIALCASCSAIQLACDRYDAESDDDDDDDSGTLEELGEPVTARA